MGIIGVIGGSGGMRTLGLLSMLFMGDSEIEIPKIYIPENKKLPEKIQKYVITFGNGKKRFVFNTEIGEVEIGADNSNSASKKLRTVNGINSEIKNKNSWVKQL